MDSACNIRPMYCTLLFRSAPFSAQGYCPIRLPLFFCGCEPYIVCTNTKSWLLMYFDTKYCSIYVNELKNNKLTI